MNIGFKGRKKELRRIVENISQMRIIVPSKENCWTYSEKGLFAALGIERQIHMGIIYDVEKEYSVCRLFVVKKIFDFKRAN